VERIACAAPNLQLTEVVSRKLQPGTVLVGDFQQSTLFTRMSVSLRASSEGIGLIDRNLTIFVAEARYALVHFRASRRSER
jgi:hypothetical protein